MINVRLTLLFSLLAHVGFGQSVFNFQGPGQIRDLLTDTSNHYTINPIQADRLLLDSLSKHQRVKLGGKGLMLKFNPLIYQVQSNTKIPVNHTSNFLIPNVGMQEVFSWGLNLNAGSILEINFQPVRYETENLPFGQYPSYSKEWVWYYYFLNRIDQPLRFSDKPIRQDYLGQSYISLRAGKLTLALSNENKWWGPSSFNPLVLGSNAPGFAHLSLRSNRPIQTKLGTFSFEMIAGLLENSGVAPPDTNRVNIYNGQRLYVPKLNKQRYATGLIYSFQPRGIPGLTLGLTKLAMTYRDETNRTFDLLPISGFFGDRISALERENKKASMGSWFLRYHMPKSLAEVYVEYGRGDQSLHVWNIIQEDAYTRGFTAGLKKSIPFKKRPGHYLQFGTELTNLSLPTREQVREQDPKSWYIDDYVRQGFTHRGYLLGSQLGPGTNSQNLYIQYLHGLNRIGVRFIRTIHNLDYYHYTSYYLTDHFNQYWVSAAAMVYSTWYLKNFSVNLNYGMQRELNYQWDWVRYTDIGFENIGNDKYNFSVNVMLSYHL